MDKRRLFFRGCRGSLIALVALAWTLALTPWAAAQAPPRLPSQLPAKNAFDANDRMAIENFSKYWATRIADPSASAETVETARVEMLDPLSRLKSPTPAFRYEYALALAPLLDPVMRTGSPHAAVNAARVLGEVIGPRAVSALLSQLDSQRWQVRLWAAIGLRNSLQPGILEARTATDAVRKLADSVRTENDSLILRYKLEAIAAADHPTLNSDDLRKVRMSLVDAIAESINRVAADPKASPEMLDAIRAATVKLRNTFISGKVNIEQQKEIGERIGPALVKVFAIANANWQAAQADESTARIYGNFVALSEEFLKRIDQYVRPSQASPRTELMTNWNSKQKDQFDAAVKQWNDVVTKSPYRP